MKRISTVVAIVVMAFGASGLMLAQGRSDRFVGTWKLNPGKSKFTQGVVAQQETVVIAEQGNRYQVTISGSMPDGSPIMLKYTIPKDCRARCTGQVQTGPYDGLSAKSVDANTFDSHFTKGGKEVRSTLFVVSQDGQTMRVTLKGMDAQGNPAAGVVLFEKQ